MRSENEERWVCPPFTQGGDHAGSRVVLSCLRFVGG